MKLILNTYFCNFSASWTSEKGPMVVSSLTKLLSFNMIWAEAKANLGKRLVSLDVDINFPDDFVAELALLCGIRRLKIGNKVSRRTPPARK